MTSPYHLEAVLGHITRALAMIERLPDESDQIALDPIVEPLDAAAQLIVARLRGIDSNRRPRIDWTPT